MYKDYIQVVRGYGGAETPNLFPMDCLWVWNMYLIFQNFSKTSSQQVGQFSVPGRWTFEGSTLRTQAPWVLLGQPYKSCPYSQPRIGCLLLQSHLFSPLWSTFLLLTRLLPFILRTSPAQCGLHTDFVWLGIKWFPLHNAFRQEVRQPKANNTYPNASATESSLCSVSVLSPGVTWLSKNNLWVRCLAKNSQLRLLHQPVD